VFRLGVISKKQIPTAIVPPGPAIALTLLEEFSDPMSDADEARFAGIYEMLQQGPEFSMKTFPNRFGELDTAIADALETTTTPDRQIRVHDMAASNAITSLELFECLHSRFRGNVSLRASDYFDALYLVSIPESRWKVIFDAGGSPVQFVRGRLVLSANREPRRYLINRLLQKCVAPALLRKASAGLSGGHRIALFHPRCVAAASACARFTLGREDVFKPETTSYDALRIMNLLIHVPPDRSRPWFVPACRTVGDGGLFVIGIAPLRTDPIDATIFQRCGSRFNPLRDLGGGYEHRQAVLDLDLDGP